jgi:hypothetical protein
MIILYKFVYYIKKSDVEDMEEIIKSSPAWLLQPRRKTYENKGYPITFESLTLFKPNFFESIFSLFTLFLNKKIYKKKRRDAINRTFRFG